MSTLHHETILEDLYDTSLYDQQLLKELEIEPYFSYTVAEMEAHAEKTARRMFEDMCQSAHMGGGISSIKSRKTHICDSVGTVTGR